ncbi:bromodomain and WD repeat-containing protein 3 [Dorcoceras hygrometricum]|uniref:Bromodomain and WD repeat-containing protein 3 n=1 Tax=Dorcoceras hygrometricum TaxID=472368 RepID=A0A2Z7A6A5_9LAMI|nr:bromodomain and WD repeat-containing protein 3 [Dorcoceras hygrometricum]
MALQKRTTTGDPPPINIKSLSFTSKENGKASLAVSQRRQTASHLDIDLKEVYFLIMHFLSAGPCLRTYGQLWNELLEHQLLPRRYHAWYSRTGSQSRDENDNGMSFPLSYNKLVERYPQIGQDHLVKLLKQLMMLDASAPSKDINGGNVFNAANVPTLLGTGSFSLLANDQNKRIEEDKLPLAYMRWPHRQADQVRGLRLREIGGGFTRHHRAPSTRAACHAIIKPSTLVQKMQNIKRVRGHRNAVYCAIFDRSGRYVVTGSDDRLVKIWSMETAYCLASCRGHEGDITDLAVNFNNTLVASASNDCVIRVWRLPDGMPISVLRGHTGAVTAIAFSPRSSAPYQLLSSSDDGSCRIWDARYSQFSPRIYVPKPSDSITGRNNVSSSSTTQPSHQIFCCAFNASGTFFVTGSSDTLARVWNAFKSSSDDSEQPNHEIDILAGHENDVNYVQFSGCAVTARFSFSDASKEDTMPKFKNSWFNHDNIVTCSRDGSAIIWIPRSRKSHGKTGRWIRAYHLKVPPPPMPPQPPRGGPRQRILPTPRGVNMIAWSLDNRFVLAAIMDCRICVWNAVDGSLVHSLTGHTESTYVLDVHPFNPRIAMSAGYDGKTIVWDIWEGMPIHTYEIGQFKLIDGKFSPDGTSIILSDDVGQLYILNTGQGESQKDAKYDQFFLGDYRPLIQDTNGNVLDQETQLAPYRRNMQDLLCDSGMIPYPEPYQSMYQKRRLGGFGIEWRPSSIRLSVGVDFSLDQDYVLPIIDLDAYVDPLPEFVDAMEWEPEIDMLSDDNDSEYHVTEDNSSGGERVSLSSNSGDPDCSSESSEDDSNRDGLRRSKRKKRKAGVFLSYCIVSFSVDFTVATKLRIKSSTIPRDYDSPRKFVSKSTSDDAVKSMHGTICVNLETEDNLDPKVTVCDDTGITCSDNRHHCGMTESEDLINETTVPVTEEPSKLDSNKRMFTAVYTRSKLSKGRSNSEGHSAGMEASTSNSGRYKLNRGIEIAPEGIRRARSIRLRSSMRDPNVLDSNFMFEVARDDSEDPSAHIEKASLSGAEENSCEEWKSDSRTSVRLRTSRNRKGGHVRGTSPADRRKSNQLSKSSWLMMSAHEEGSRYIPQLGDEVVYLRQGHKEYITQSGSRETGPWETIKQNIKAVEFCRVQNLEYSTRPGSGESCCKMTLKFVSPSNVVGSFKLTLPEVTGYPDFLVEKSRYDAAMERNWTSRDKCKVWWKNEADENGNWWAGRILAVKPKSFEFPDSPWERYAVKYKSEPTETHLHSPWELYDEDTIVEQVHIDDGIREKLLHALEKLEKSGTKSQDYYGVNKLKQVSQKTQFINRFPVPLTLELIHSRLENNYYRSLEALKHDIEVMLLNAESYFGKNAELSTKMKHLSDWFRRTLLPL